MKVLLDTHAFAWVLRNDPSLSKDAREMIAAADAVFVSAVTVYEIGQKVRLGRWPEMAPYAEELPQRASAAGILDAPLTPVIALRASLLDWHHRDPFDRIIAATAEAMDARLVSRDPAFDGLPLRRVW